MKTFILALIGCATAARLPTTTPQNLAEVDREEKFYTTLDLGTADLAATTDQGYLIQSNLGADTFVTSDTSNLTSCACQCASPVCDRANLSNCACGLPELPLGSATTARYNQSSTAATTAMNEEVPDKLFQTDAVACSEGCAAAAQGESNHEISKRTFSIGGNIVVTEKYQDQSCGSQEQKEKGNFCKHSESRTQLVNNLPPPSSAPCVCA